ncbi:MAG: type II secretion system protein [Verrucomicrobiota bacterium]
MTLLEICFSLLIIGIVFGVAIPFSQEMFKQHPLEDQAIAFEELVLTAMHESRRENYTARIVFEKNAIKLFGQAKRNNLEDIEAPTTVLDEILIPGGSKYELQMWPNFEWSKPNDSGWNIPNNGLILPLNIKWTLDDSWLAASVDPMTGELKDITYELN